LHRRIISASALFAFIANSEMQSKPGTIFVFIRALPSYLRLAYCSLKSQSLIFITTLSIWLLKYSVFNFMIFVNLVVFPNWLKLFVSFPFGQVSFVPIYWPSVWLVLASALHFIRRRPQHSSLTVPFPSTLWKFNELLWPLLPFLC